MRRLSRLALAGLAGLSAPAMAHAAEGYPPPWLDITTNVTFVILLCFLGVVWYFGGFRIVTNALDKRGEEIAARIDEAKSLREQAARMLAEAERKQRQAEEDAEAIVKAARADADAMMEEARAELQQRIKRRQALAEARIARAEAQASEEVRKAAADAATRAARDILAKDKSVDQFERAAVAIEKALN